MSRYERYGAHSTTSSGPEPGLCSDVVVPARPGAFRACGRAPAAGSYRARRRALRPRLTADHQRAARRTVDEHRVAAAAEASEHCVCAPARRHGERPATDRDAVRRAVARDQREPDEHVGRSGHGWGRQLPAIADRERGRQAHVRSPGGADAGGRRGARSRLRLRPHGGRRRRWRAARLAGSVRRRPAARRDEGRQRERRY